MWLLSLIASVVSICQEGVTPNNLLYTYLGWLQQFILNIIIWVG